MLRLPAVLQPALTALTGKAAPGQKPWWRWSPAGKMWLTFASFAATIGAGAFAVQTGGAALLLLPLAWLLAVSNARIIQTGIVHHASHGTLLTDKLKNELAGEFLSLLIWIAPLAKYREEHGPHHKQTAEEGDKDLALLAGIGRLVPGLPVSEYRRRFWLTMFSPRFHGEFLWSRLKGNFAWPAKQPPQENEKQQNAKSRLRLARARWAGSLVFAAILLTLAVTGFGAALLWAYLFPITVLVQMSAWAGLLGLHQWVPASGAELSRAAKVASLTSGRFVGEAVPSADLTGITAAVAWTRWTVRMLVLHLPARLAVVPGDLPSHDWHHFIPISREWANAAYARRDHLVSGSSKARLYTEIWGVGAAIGATFARLAELPPDAVLGQPLTYAERERGFGDM